MRAARTGLVMLVAIALTSCGSPQGYMEGAGPAARSLASLGWLALIAFSAATIITWLLIGWVATRRRGGSLAEHAPIDVNQGQRWILIGGFAIPFAVLAILFISMLDSLAAFPMGHGEHAGTPQIRVSGRQWWFTAEYQFAQQQLNVTAPTEIHIPVGQPVDIALQSHDVIHSFWVPKLHGKVDLVPGHLNFIRIQADEPGVYEGECAEYCGAQHAHMRFVVVAEKPSEYQRWLDHQRAPAMEPASPDAIRGYDVFMNAACPLCHMVRGTEARGHAGPDLTHVASRIRIAGGAFQNNTANLQAWVTHAQSMKPGAAMPNLTQFTGEELRSLVAYLQSLR